jgi:hypothetical protein
MTTYFKLLTPGSRRHLMKPDQADAGTTLCGCLVTGGLGWRRISALEGDECEKCAQLSFWSSAAASSSREAKQLS